MFKKVMVRKNGQGNGKDTNNKILSISHRLAHGLMNEPNKLDSFILKAINGGERDVQDED